MVVVDIQIPPAVKRLKGRILHLPGGIERFAPLLTRALEDYGTDGLGFFDYLASAQEAIKRGRKEKIEVVDGVPRWVEPGQQIDVNLKLYTLSDVYTWGVEILRGSKWIPLYQSDGKPGNDGHVTGLGERETSFSVRLPADLSKGTAHRLIFRLWNRNGKSVAAIMRKVRTRKS